MLLHISDSRWKVLGSLSRLLLPHIPRHFILVVAKLDESDCVVSAAVSLVSQIEPRSCEKVESASQPC